MHVFEFVVKGKNQVWIMVFRSDRKKKPFCCRLACLGLKEEINALKGESVLNADPHSKKHISPIDSRHERKAHSVSKVKFCVGTHTREY